MILTINAHREEYAPDQITSTMTVGELIEFLNNFDVDEKVYLSHDNGYTYGGITASRFEGTKRSTSATTTAIPTAGLPLPGSKKSRKKPKTNKPNQGGRKTAHNQRRKK